MVATGCGSDRDSESRAAWTAGDAQCAASRYIVVTDVYPSVPEADGVTLRLRVLESLKGDAPEVLEVRHTFAGTDIPNPRRGVRAERLGSPHSAAGSSELLSSVRAKALHRVGRPTHAAFPEAADVEQLTGRTMIAFVRTTPDGQLRLAAAARTAGADRGALVPNAPDTRQAILQTLEAHRAATRAALPPTEVDDVVTALVDGLRHNRSAAASALTRLCRMSRTAVPALVRQLAPTPRQSPYLDEPEVIDALLAALTCITAEDLGLGGTPAARRQSIDAWHVRARYSSARIVADASNPGTR